MKYIDFIVVMIAFKIIMLTNILLFPLGLFSKTICQIIQYNARFGMTLCDGWTNRYKDT